MVYYIGDYVKAKNKDYLMMVTGTNGKNIQCVYKNETGAILYEYYNVSELDYVKVNFEHIPKHINNE